VLGGAGAVHHLMIDMGNVIGDINFVAKMNLPVPA
jgi:hypothetical protein